jgi:hypothetical protein
MKKTLIGLLAVLLGIAVLVFGLEIVASESGEVVVVTTPTDAGPSTTRLWVVDVDGDQYLRAGHVEASWYAPLVGADVVEVERGGTAGRYRAVPAPELLDRVNAAFADKYGWRETYIGMMVGGREHAVPIRLEPVSSESS